MKFADTLKIVEYNNKQTPCNTLKTLRGSPIKRSKYGVGKEIGGDIYVHGSYALSVIPKDILDFTIEQIGDFKYNCIRYSPKTLSVAFQEVPDFDTAREPVVGDYIVVSRDGSIRKGHSDYIFHHKWLWVKDDYKGFDVQKSWEWSRKWLNVLTEPSDGNGIKRWLEQLKRFNI